MLSALPRLSHIAPQSRPYRHSETGATGLLSGTLEQLLALHSGEQQLQLRHLFEALAGRGHAALLVVIALPFSLPLPLFGLSTIFGAILAFIGLRIAFRRRPWLPRWILAKPLRRETIAGLARRMARLEKHTRKFLRARSVWLCHQPSLHRAHGLTVTILAMLLALPLPIPASNIIAAVPIVIIGLALLEDDGWFMIAGYAVSAIAVGAFGFLLWAGGIGVERLFDNS